MKIEGELKTGGMGARAIVNQDRMLALHIVNQGLVHGTTNPDRVNRESHAIEVKFKAMKKARDLYYMKLQSQPYRQFCKDWK